MRPIHLSVCMVTMLCTGVAFAASPVPTFTWRKRVITVLCLLRRFSPGRPTTYPLNYLYSIGNQYAVVYVPYCNDAIQTFKIATAGDLTFQGATIYNNSDQS